MKISQIGTTTEFCSLMSVGETNSADAFSSIPLFIREVVDDVKAHGCVVWESVPEGLGKSRTVVLFEEIPLGPLGERDGSLLRQIVYEECLGQNRRLDLEESAQPMHKIFDGTNFSSIFSLPLGFSHGARGAVTFFHQNGKTFSEEYKNRISQALKAFPFLLQNAETQNLLSITSSVDQYLAHFFEGEFSDLNLDKRNYRGSIRFENTIKEICVSLIDFLKCSLISLHFSENSEVGKSIVRYHYDLKQKQKRLNYSSLKKDLECIAKWVGDTNTPFIYSVPDLLANSMENDRYRDLPEVLQKVIRRLTNTIGKYHFLSVSQKLPFSIYAIPKMTPSVKGVCICLGSVHPFFQNTERFLSMVRGFLPRINTASIIGLRQTHSEEETKVWERLVRGMEELNSVAQRELSSSTPELKLLLLTALHETRATIEETDILDIRLKDEEGECLYFAETLGDAWSKGNLIQERARKEKSFPLGNDPPKSAGEWVMIHGETYTITQKSKLKDPYYCGTFDEALEMIIAPIKAGAKTLGVLDLRTTNKRGFLPTAQRVASLIGQQLGLNLFAIQAAEDLNRNLREMEHSQEDKLQALENIAHQLRNPVFQAYERIRAHLAGEIEKNKLEWNLTAVRGLCRRAKSVVKSIRLFTDLAGGGPIYTNPERIIAKYLISLLKETARDTEISIKPERNITFRVNFNSFEKVDFQMLFIDKELLEQAISCVFDNAAKYSFSNTKVHISGGITKSQRFSITTENTGARIRPDEISTIKERMKRGRDVVLSTGEGTGIGLWVVNQIMLAHEGDLEITPTTREGKTEVKLIFPIGAKGVY